MSGGSFDYGYTRIEYDYAGYMQDREMDDLMKDVAEVMHDLEWWQSGDIGEENYRETIKKFKQKWFKQSNNKRIKKYINDELNQFKENLNGLLGGENE